MLRIALIFAHPRVVFWLFPAIMALLVMGTLAQVELGLFEAERRYFSGWVIWAGPLPLPGMPALLLALALGLAAKLILKSPWRKTTSGTVITHMGALLLLAGGLATSLTAQEGFLALAEGDRGNVVSDYHARELVLLDEDGRTVWRTGVDDLREGDEIADAAFSAMTIEKLYANALPMWREEASAAEQGIAQQIDLKPLPPEKQNEANLAGAVIHLKGHGRYVLFEPMQNRPVIDAQGRALTLAIRKEQRALPFTVRLIDFEKIRYPGTDTAREYQSQVEIDEGVGLVWQALIRMNEPLRVKGHTLYQSSFVERDGTEVSVLAVVKNRGRVFPYVACLMLAAGLIVHLIVRRRG